MAKDNYKYKEEDEIAGSIKKLARSIDLLAGAMNRQRKIIISDPADEVEHIDTTMIRMPDGQSKSNKLPDDYKMD